ncbi:MAG: hypothetical protein ACRBB0_13940 [Pelagimonas sp.]|uniref:hypothetical protein n=1 Tax=Pelagimonas sp. TaxID=2073170 RepID=UPI003D69FF39
MKLTFLAALPLTIATLAFASTAQAGHVVCADGTIYNLTGDEITSEVACAKHGGLSPTQKPGANTVQTNTPHPSVPDRSKPGKGVATFAPTRGG